MAERFGFPGPARGPWPGESEEHMAKKSRGFLLDAIGAALDATVPGFSDEDDAEAEQHGTESEGSRVGGGAGGAHGGVGAGGAGAPASGGASGGAAGGAPAAPG